MKAFLRKMEGDGQSAAAIRSFVRNFEHVQAAGRVMIAEADIAPAGELPRLEALPGPEAGAPARELLDATVIIKLNGGLGTGMGLEGPKSLVPVRDGHTFLDLIVRQVLDLRRRHRAQLPFLLMNSYATSGDTLGYLERYPELGERRELELMQSRVPKIDAATLAPAEYPADPDLEWCPPGHGDLYASLLGTGWLDLLLGRGVRHAFVSNSDNLGATLDVDLLRYFANSERPLLMEVTARTAADRKGGHLAIRRRDGGFVLRESAQCPQEDLPAFQDIARHRYFNTNNLWLRLDRLKEALDRNDGILPLPVIRNEKTLNPRDSASARVFQLETAMGAAIECFEGAGAIEVTRSRFAPVKTTDDLFALRSDAYELTDDFRLTLHPEREGNPPLVTLDAHYRHLDQLEEAVRKGVPSLLRCRTLRVRGAVAFSSAVVVEGDVVIENPGTKRAELPAGTIADRTLVISAG